MRERARYRARECARERARELVRERAWERAKAIPLFRDRKFHFAQKIYLLSLNRSPLANVSFHWI